LNPASTVITETGHESAPPGSPGKLTQAGQCPTVTMNAQAQSSRVAIGPIAIAHSGLYQSPRWIRLNGDVCVAQSPPTAKFKRKQRRDWTSNLHGAEFD